MDIFLRFLNNTTRIFLVNSQECAGWVVRMAFTMYASNGYLLDEKKTSVTFVAKGRQFTLTIDISPDLNIWNTGVEGKKYLNTTELLIQMIQKQ